MPWEALTISFACFEQFLIFFEKAIYEKYYLLIYNFQLTKLHFFPGEASSKTLGIFWDLLVKENSDCEFRLI